MGPEFSFGLFNRHTGRACCLNLRHDFTEYALVLVLTKKEVPDGAVCVFRQEVAVIVSDSVKDIPTDAPDIIGFTFTFVSFRRFGSKDFFSPFFQ